MMTPPPSHTDRGGIVTVTDKPLHQTFNITSKNEYLGEEVIGTNFDNRPITEQRKREICEELGFNFDWLTQLQWSGAWIRIEEYLVFNKT